MPLIRTAHLADAPTVYRMIRAIAHEQGDQALFTATLADVKRDGFGPEAVYTTLLAELQGQPSGLASFFPSYSTFRGKPCLHLDNLYVEGWARRRGIAQALLARVAEIAHSRGCCRVELHARAGIAAIRVYQKLGFQDGGNLSMSLQGSALEALAASAYPSQ